MRSLAALRRFGMTSAGGVHFSVSAAAIAFPHGFLDRINRMDRILGGADIAILPS